MSDKKHREEQNGPAWGYDLFLLCFFEYLLLKGWIYFAVDFKPVDVETMVQSEVIFQMPNGCDSLRKSFTVPTVEGFRPEAHLH